MLRFTDLNSKLILVIETYQFIESTIKGGIFMICEGYAEANNKLIQKIFYLDIHSNNSLIGCFLEVDLDYADELQDFHNDYPLSGERIKVT